MVLPQVKSKSTTLPDRYSNGTTSVLGLQSLTSKQRLVIRGISTGEVSFCRIEDAFDWLIAQRGFKVCWALGDFVAPMLSLLPTGTLEALYRTGKITIGDYEVYYNTGKSFNVNKGKKWASVYWLEQYYEGEPEPSLEELEAKGRELLAELATIGVHPRRLTSAVSIFTEAFDKIPLPTWKDVPDRVNELAWICSGCAWTEAHKLGHFKESYDYDLSSAFPSVIATLLDTRYGKWVESTTIPESAVYGVGYGTVRVSSDLSPILFHAADTRFYSPKGIWDRPLMLPHIRWLKESGSGDFTVDEGHWWIPNKIVLPYQLIMHKMFRERKLSRLLNRVVKRGMNIIYGTTLETHRDGSFGKRFMPLYGGTIETEIGVKVASFLLENQKSHNLIHVSTDGVLLDSPISLSVSDGGMGHWRLDSVGASLVVSSGVLFYGSKRPNQIAYEEAMSMIESDPDNYEWHKFFQRKMTLGDLIENHLPIGTMQTVSTSFGLSNQHDREFKGLPRSGRELLGNTYNSTALNVKKLSFYKE